MICSDNGSHFRNEPLQTLERHLGIKHRFGSVYHPQSQGLVERKNGQLKQMLATGLSALGQNSAGPDGEELKTRLLLLQKEKGTWMSLLPITLMVMRNRPQSKFNQLTPHELITGRPMPGPYQPVGPPCDHSTAAVEKYCQALTQASQRLYTQDTTPAPEEEPDTQVGEYLWVKKHKSKFPEPRWEGPYKVLLATPYSVSLAQRKGAAWVHKSQCRRAVQPQDEEPHPDDPVRPAEGSVRGVLPRGRDNHVPPGPPRLAGSPPGAPAGPN